MSVTDVKPKSKKASNPKVLYHYTCLFHINRILDCRYLKLTESNFSLREAGLNPVVWMTEMPTPDNQGLLFDQNMPDEINKTFYRISIQWKKHFRQWDEWSEEKGIDPKFKLALIESAGAQETYKSWYVSENTVPINNWITIEDVRTGKVLFKWEGRVFRKQE